jgi:hypothetical protein
MNICRDDTCRDGDKASDGCDGVVPRGSAARKVVGRCVVWMGVWASWRSCGDVESRLVVSHASARRQTREGDAHPVRAQSCLSHPFFSTACCAITAG